MPGARRGGGVWTPAGGGDMGARRGGVIGALKHFCKVGVSPKKAPHNKKRDPPDREKSSRKALPW